MSQVSGEVREFLRTDLGRDVSQLASDASLLEAGMIDSVGVLALVAFLERRYGISVADDDMMPENFDTIDAIVGFVERRRSETRA